MFIYNETCQVNRGQNTSGEYLVITLFSLADFFLFDCVIFDWHMYFSPRVSLSLHSERMNDYSIISGHYYMNFSASISSSRKKNMKYHESYQNTLWMYIRVCVCVCVCVSMCHLLMCMRVVKVCTNNNF